MHAGGERMRSPPTLFWQIMIANFSYVEKSSFIHRLDPRTKIILLLVAAFTAASLRDLRGLSVLLVLAVTYYSLARFRGARRKRAWNFLSSLLSSWLDSIHLSLARDRAKQMMSCCCVCHLASRSPGRI